MTRQAGRLKLTMARPAINIYGTPIKLNKRGDTKIAGVFIRNTTHTGKRGRRDGRENNNNKTNAESYNFVERQKKEERVFALS